MLDRAMIVRGVLGELLRVVFVSLIVGCVQSWVVASFGTYSVGSVLVFCAWGLFLWSMCTTSRVRLTGIFQSCKTDPVHSALKIMVGIFCAFLFFYPRVTGDMVLIVFFFVLGLMCPLLAAKFIDAPVLTRSVLSKKVSRILHRLPTIPSDSAVLGCRLDGSLFSVPLSLFHRNHACFVGESGTGKSVMASRVLQACVLNQQPVIIVDPKNDLYLLKTIARVVEHTNSTITVLDLRADAPPQINPFFGATVQNVRQLLVSAFGIQDTPDAAVNFYRHQDREAAALAAQLIVNEQLCYPEFLLKASRLKAIYRCEQFWRLCREVGLLRPVQTRRGFDISQAIQPKHVLYIIGSTEDERVHIVTKLVLQRLLQCIYAQTETQRPYLTIFIDELRYLLSEILLNSLSTIRDRRVHLLLAFQDIDNLLENRALNPYAVRSIVTANTGIKFVFRISHLATADLFEKMSRQQSTFDRSFHRSRGYISESWIEKKRHALTRETIMHFPKPTFDGDLCQGYAFYDGQESSFVTLPLPSGVRPACYCAPAFAGQGIVSLDDLI